MTTRRDICLVMNAKERPEIVERAVRSALPLVGSYMVSVEPGDPLGPQIREMFGDVPGEIVEFERTSGGQARTLMMQHGERVAREHGATYLLNLDADDELAAAPGFEWPALVFDSYVLDHVNGPRHFPFRRLFRVGLDWSWKGVLHEVPVTGAPGGETTRGFVPGLAYIYRTDDESKRTAERYAEHAKILAAELERDPSCTRTAYYLAQSLRDAGEWRHAFDAYVHRAKMLGGYQDEVYASLMECGSIAEHTGQPWGIAQNFYVDAHAFAPHRAEPLYRIALHWYDEGSPSLALMFAERGMQLEQPDGAFLVDEDVYRAGLPGLVAATAFECGQFELGLRATRIALRTAPDAPELLEALAKYVAALPDGARLRSVAA